MTTSAPEAIAAGTTWAPDALHSTLDFRVRHFGLTWLRGGFNEFAVTLTADEQGDLQLVGEVAVADISFANEALVGHLKSPDFFDEQLHPKLTYTSTSVELASDGTATVVGDLTLRGVSKSVELTGNWSGPVTGLGGDTRLGIELAGQIDRTDFGIDWAAQLPSGGDVLTKVVKLSTELELVQQ